jgi:dsDNA-specific endonuclease/ATPase MutS2
MAIRNLKKFITTRQTEEKELYKIIFPLYTNHDFEMRIEKSFADDATVLDSASPELTRIRGAIRQIQQNIREKLQKTNAG